MATDDAAACASAASAAISDFGSLLQENQTQHIAFFSRLILIVLASLFLLHFTFLSFSVLGADPFLHHPALLGPNHCLLSCILSLFPLLSSLSAVLPLFSLLPISQIPLRTRHFEFRIRPSIPLLIHSTLCLTVLGPNYCFLRPSHLDCACLSLLASLCALPSSLLGADPFLYHPALLGSNHCVL